MANSRTKDCHNKEDILLLRKRYHELSEICTKNSLLVSEHDREIEQIKVTIKGYLPSKVFWTILTIFLGVIGAVMSFQLMLISDITAELKSLNKAFNTELAETKTDVNWIKRELERAQIMAE